MGGAGTGGVWKKKEWQWMDDGGVGRMWEFFAFEVFRSVGSGNSADFHYEMSVVASNGRIGCNGVHRILKMEKYY